MTRFFSFFHVMISSHENMDASNFSKSDISQCLKRKKERLAPVQATAQPHVDWSGFTPSLKSHTHSYLLSMWAQWPILVFKATVVNH